MKKEIQLITLLFVIGLTIMFIISCQQKTAQILQKNESKNELPVAQPTPPKNEIIKTPIPENVKTLLAGKDKVRSYSYSYGALNKRNTYNIVGNKVKIQLLEKPGKKPVDQYDTVFLDNTKKKAFASCEKECDISVYNKYRPIDYNMYKLSIMPFDIFNNITKIEIILGRNKIINNRDTVLLNITNDKSENMEAYVDKFFAFPHEFRIIDPTGKETFIQYFNVQINSLQEQDVTLPSNYELQNITG